MPDRYHNDPGAKGLDGTSLEAADCIPRRGESRISKGSRSARAERASGFDRPRYSSWLGGKRRLNSISRRSEVASHSVIPWSVSADFNNVPTSSARQMASLDAANVRGMSASIAFLRRSSRHSCRRKWFTDLMPKYRLRSPASSSRGVHGLRLLYKTPRQLMSVRRDPATASRIRPRQSRWST